MSGFVLTDEDKRALLRLARETIVRFIGHEERMRVDDSALSPGMKQVAGAFVTLHLDGMLRGCIGEIEPHRELWRAVRDHAVNAAAHDPRFAPVDLDEMAQIEIEISALTPPVPVESPDEIEIGRHGVVLQKNRRSAVFLPQVAPEQGWDLEQTLTHLSLKAGLGPDDWRDGASFLVFEAIVFSEAQFR